MANTAAELPHVGQEPTETCELPIQGMTCASCVRRVERALLSLGGVAEANVNLVTQRATVRFDPSLTNVDGLAMAVKAAGYCVFRSHLNADSDGTRAPIPMVKSDSMGNTLPG